MRTRQSVIHSHFGPRDVRPLEKGKFNPKSFRDVLRLSAIGIGMDEEMVEKMKGKVASGQPETDTYPESAGEVQF